MEELYNTYHSYEPSDRCWLDGTYFNPVFDEYHGLVTEPLIVELTPKGNLVTGPKHFNIPENVFGLIRVKIRISRLGKDSIMRHSNLVILDQKEKEVLRFEPLLDHEYNDKINDELEKYFKRFLPEYTYVEIDNHPQKYDEMCPDKGMCVAYVIKAALMFAMNTVYMEEEEMSTEESLDDIKRFAAAVEHIFNL